MPLWRPSSMGRWCEPTLNRTSCRMVAAGKGSDRYESLNLVSAGRMNQLKYRHFLAPSEGHCLGHGATSVQAGGCDTSTACMISASSSSGTTAHPCGAARPRSTIALYNDEV